MPHHAEVALLTRSWSLFYKLADCIMSVWRSRGAGETSLARALLSVSTVGQSTARMLGGS